MARNDKTVIEAINSINTEISNQETLLQTLSTALDGKAVGGNIATDEKVLTETGDFLQLEGLAGKKLTVTSNVTDATDCWMVHCGRNLIPTMPITGTCVEVDGGFTATATDSIIYLESQKVWIPAGTYNFSLYDALQPGSGTNICAYLQVDDNDWDHCLHELSLSINITLSAPTQIKLFCTVAAGYTATIRPVLIPGTVRADFYESYKGIVYEQHFDTATTQKHTWADITAFDGTNTIYDSTGDLSVSWTEANTGEPSGISSFDYKAYDLPIINLTGDVSTMTKEQSVTLEYIYGDLTGTLTCKWQGSSSLAYPKKNYTLKFDNAFEAKSGWGLHNKYVLKANYMDYSHARNVCSAKLWGEIVKSRTTVDSKMESAPNYGAIDGFPVLVVINGVYQGLYTFNIPKDSWMFSMGDSDTECFVSADAFCDATYFKAEATLNGDFEVEYAPNEDETEWIKTSLNRLINACQNSTETNLDTIGQYIDWESVIDYYIFVMLLCGEDMTAKNYILATYNGTKWIMSAYDMDSVFGLAWDGKSTYAPNHIGDSSIFYGDQHKLMSLIKTYKKTELKDRYNALRQTSLSEYNVTKVINDFAGAIPKAMYDAETTLWTGIPGTTINNLNQILNWYRLRCQYMDYVINNELDNL